MAKCWNIGTCGKETVEGTNFCKEHLGLKCTALGPRYGMGKEIQPDGSTKWRECGEQATHYCNGFNGSFVCGNPLCKEHRDCH